MDWLTYSSNLATISIKLIKVTNLLQIVLSVHHLGCQCRRKSGSLDFNICSRTIQEG
jgi:hypothetical protein